MLSVHAKIAALLLLGLTVLVIGVLLIARTQPIPTINVAIEPYLPGHSLPRFTAGDNCHSFEYLQLSCEIQRGHQSIHLEYDLQIRQITLTLIRAPQYTIGDLLTAWGSPTGLVQYDSSFSIIWGTRRAVLNTHSPRLENHIEFIQYDLMLQQTAPWHELGIDKGD